MPTLEEIVAFLDAQRLRATYGAVAGALGVAERSLGARLGPRRKECSWVVAKKTGLPTGYLPSEQHELLASTPLIDKVADLLTKMGFSAEVAESVALSDRARRAVRKRRSNERVAAARRTARWAVTMTRVLITKAAASAPRGRRWSVLSFYGPMGAESRGIVDLLAIRKNHAMEADGFSRGDLFEMILIQVKGGTSPNPTADDIRRLSLVRDHYRAKDVVLASWQQGRAPTFRRLLGSGAWNDEQAAEDIFG